MTDEKPSWVAQGLHWVFSHPWHLAGGLLAFQCFFIGASFLNSVKTFGRSPAYELLALLVNEDIWGVVWIIAGVLRLAVFLTTGDFAKALVNMLIAFMCLFTAICFLFSGGFATPAIALYLSSAVWAMALATRRYFYRGLS